MPAAHGGCALPDFPGSAPVASSDVDLSASQRRIEAGIERLTAMVQSLRDDLRSPSGAGGEDMSLIRSTKRRGTGAGTPQRINTNTAESDPDVETSAVRSFTNKALRSSATFENLMLFSLEPSLASLGDAHITNAASGSSAAGEWPSTVKMRGYLADGDTEFDNMPLRHSDALSAMMPDGSSVSDSRSRRMALGSDADLFAAVPAMFAAFGLTVLMHDMMVIPFALAWQLDFTGYLAASSWCSVSFWVLDVCVSVSWGLISLWFDGTAASNHTRGYIKTWLCPDVVLVATDLLSLTLEMCVDGSGEVSVGGLRPLRSAKLARFLRILGIFRILRILRTLQEVFEHLLSDNLRMVFSALALLTGTIWCNHMMACVWFATGKFGATDTGARWLDINVSYNDDFSATYSSLGREYQYLTSLHFALALFCLDSMELPCTNASERTLAVLWLAMGLMFGSMLVSTLSATMVELQSLKHDKDQKLRGLRRYLRQNPVDKNLSIRVMRQVQERLQARAATGEASVPALEFLSKGLRAELHTRICAPALLLHPFFRLWASIDANWFDRFCSEAVLLECLREADDLFVTGTSAPAAYVMLQGSINYVQPAGPGGFSRESVHILHAGAWVCEVALWCEWSHVGTATANEICKILTINGERVVNVCRSHRTIGALAQEYCRSFHTRVVNARPPYRYPSDISVPGTEFGDLVSTMSRSARRSIGVHAVNTCFESSVAGAVAPLIGMVKRRSMQHHLTAESLRAELLSEVCEGKCTMVIDGRGHLQRVVSVIALRVLRDNGAVFMQVGKCDSHVVQAACELPGMKRAQDETVDESIDRMLRTKLAPFLDIIELEDVECTSSTGQSGQYRVRTKYLRTVCTARLTGDCTLPRCTFGFDEMVMVSAGTSSRISSQVATVSSVTTVAPTRSDASVPHVQDVHRLSTLLPRALVHGPVFFLGEPEKGTYYAWLQPSEAEEVQRAACKPILEAWLGQLVLPMPAPDDDVDSVMAL